MRRAVYPGSFDPVTNGHMDIIRRSASIFDELIVAVSNNPNKKHLFTIDERIEIIESLTSDIKNIRIEYFDTLLVDYVREKQVNVVVRGLRAVTDFEMEFQMALVNKKMHQEMETIFLVTSAEYSYLSSSIIREIASYGGDVSSLVAPIVVEKLNVKLDRR
ncbi:MAG TPA: pantetheine-phosphate adenylyltransferase [bacterium]|nr:pantetheine-phosphate adenylyltransferase [bacterium]